MVIFEKFNLRRVVFRIAKYFFREFMKVWKRRLARTIAKILLGF